MNVDNELDPQEMSERAMLRARDFTFRGKSLHAWDYLRKTTAIKLGLKWGFVPEGDLVRVPLPDKKGALQMSVVTYRGIEEDASLVLWLLTQDGPTCRTARANPRQAQETIDEWAEEQKLVSDSMDYDEEAMKVFRDIMSDEAAVTGVPEATESDSKKKPVRDSGRSKLGHDGGNRQRRFRGKR